MTEKQIEENARINNEMKLITAEIRSSRDIANHCGLENITYAIMTYRNNKDLQRFQK